MKTFTTKQQVAGLIGWFVISFAASFIGVLASIQAASFYADLTQPSWAPPAWLFGPVWSTLYAMMAVAAWLVWRRGGWSSNKSALTWFGLQLALNALWSWLFFAWHLGLWSFIDIVVLWLAILITVVYFWRRHRLAGILLLPYLAWVSFAAVLNFTMWHLNPGMLG